MADNALLQDLLGAMKAYTQQYGVPDSIDQLRGIAGALATVQQAAGQISLQAKATEALIAQAVELFRQGAATPLLVDAAKQALAQQAYQHQANLEAKVRETLNAYVQQIALKLPADQLEGAIASIVPLVYDGNLTKSEVVSLVQRVVSSFDPSTALTDLINPRSLEVVQQLALSLAQKPIEQAALETVVAYVKKFEPTLEAISEDLINHAISAITQLPIDFDWKVDLNLKDKSLLVKQVAFNLNIMQADPIPSNAANLVADQVHNEIERFQQERTTSLGTVDVTKGITSNDGLDISSGWTVTPKSVES